MLEQQLVELALPGDELGIGGVDVGLDAVRGLGMDGHGAHRRDAGPGCQDDAGASPLRYRYEHQCCTLDPRARGLMAGKNVNRAHLSEAVYQEVGLSRNESAQLVDSVLDEIASSLTNGEAVKISSFGSFSVRQKGQRNGRNPKTGEEVPILPRKVLVFRPSRVLKDRVNDALGGTTQS